MKRVIVKEGQSKVISSYFNRKEFISNAKKAIFELLGEIAGKTVQKNIESSGLDKMHLHFNPDLLPFLEVALKKKFNDYMYKQIFYVGKKNLSLNKKNIFYIDKSINYRIIYPFKIAVKSKIKRSTYRMLNLENYKKAKTEINTAIKKQSKYKMTKADLNKIKYFNNLPVTCFGHGPHRDTWFGHTFSALNLWWSITGVTEKSGMTIYKDVNKFELDHDDDPAYVKTEQYLGKPKTISLKDGNLLVFDPEILHSTRLNGSNQTRIVFSGRINKIKPTFYKKSKASEYPHWLLSEDLEKGEYNKIHDFFRKDNSIIKPFRKKITKKRDVIININNNFCSNYKFKLIKTNKINKKKSYKIKFLNTTLCMIYVKNKIKVFNTKCPHLQADLSQGYFKNNHVVCPGHQLTYNLDNGNSTCKNFRIKLFKTKIENDYLFLQT